ncbi:MAG: Gfo/Idh/MocA family oxidoreductase [Planctomycetales bacterium]|nr:Gfo/Idh/MocA family oxidoreductase [Planctomycetales bacterium]
MSDRQSEASSTRRRFLQSSAAATAALGTFAIPGNVHADSGEMLKIGLIGSGGRGTGAAIDALHADPQAKLTAIGDVFLDRAQASLQSLQQNEEIASRVVVSEENVFSGFDAYQKVIDQVDVVLLTATPHFRPRHLAYAVEKGKHCFVEKPIAVDAPGVHSVIASCQAAKEKGLSIVSGLCWRYDLGVQETMRQILEEKAIGDIVAIESSYNAGLLWHRGDKPEWSRMEYQLRNWYYYTWLSGDHITEQAIHSLDKTAWLLGDQAPIRATALGGRQQRTDKKFGHIFDHFTVFYEYPEGKRVYFTCRQQEGCTSHVDERVLGTKGQAEVLRHRLYDSAGKPTWRYEGPKPSMYRVEHQKLFESIRQGEPINNADYMTNSTMIAIMGRMSAYSGKTLSWDECFQSDKQLGPAEYDWVDVEEPAVAIPGKAQPV